MLSLEVNKDLVVFSFLFALSLNLSLHITFIHIWSFTSIFSLDIQKEIHVNLVFFNRCLP
jgi:hypothetical protein